MHSTTQATISADESSGGTWRWHLLLTKPLAEPTATVNLERQGYRVYHPRLKHRVLRGRVWRDAISSLFPRYLFVRLNASVQTLAPIRSTLGVSSVVRFGTEYAVVPNSIVDGLMGRADPHSGLHSLRKGLDLQRGTAVRIISGALTGLDGIFETEDGSHRVTVLLSLLGREAQIKVPFDSIAPS